VPTALAGGQVGEILKAFLINTKIRKKISLVEEKLEYLLNLLEKNYQEDTQTIFKTIFKNEMEIAALWSVKPLIKNNIDVDFLLDYFFMLRLGNEKMMLIEKIETLYQLNRLPKGKLDKWSLPVYNKKLKSLSK